MFKRMTRFSVRGGSASSAKKITKIIQPIFIASTLFLSIGNFNLALASSTSGANQTNGSYVVKLSDATHYGDLISVGNNLQHRFLGNLDARFKNIYTFQSTKSLVDLKVSLAGEFNFLEINNFLNSSGFFVNDPGFGTDVQNIDKQWGLLKAGFPDAWQKTTGSKNNIVAVIDTGVDATHEDLKNINYVPGFDFIAHKSIQPGVNSDDNGHGTLVAGVLGASVNNGIGIAGTNWQISVMPIKALDLNGKGDTVSVSEAIIWATDHGAQFINLSIGGIGFGHDTTLAGAVTYAFNKNVLIVAAAGNDVATTGGNLDQSPIFPICDDNNYNMVIGVAATDQNDIKPEFSNYGKNCIDVTAPGKRILSTINIDPLNKTRSPNSYAYASGTSLAVPFVIGQAALIKSLYPQATNIQIRGRIITTADAVDNLNLSQCGGQSCRGLLGAGRINVPKSIQSAISQDFAEGDLLKITDLNGAVYQIFGGQKRLVSSFVNNQRFFGATFKTALFSQLSSFPEGPYVTPQEGTLVKYDQGPTVYIIQNGQKMPVTSTVFFQRKLSFDNVQTLSFPELDSWATGSFYSPAEGTLLRTVKNKTVYWVVGQSLHPINYNFYVEKGLNVFPVLTVSDNDINSYAKGEAYIR